MLSVDTVTFISNSYTVMFISQVLIMAGLITIAIFYGIIFKSRKLKKSVATLQTQVVVIATFPRHWSCSIAKSLYSWVAFLRSLLKTNPSIWSTNVLTIAVCS